MISKDAAYKIIEDLVIRFEDQIKSYKKAGYNATQMCDGWYSYEAKFIKNLPIILADKNQKFLHDEMFSW
jgi:hypothetical protein